MTLTDNVERIGPNPATRTEAEARVHHELNIAIKALATVVTLNRLHADKISKAETAIDRSRKYIGILGTENAALRAENERMREALQTAHNEMAALIRYPGAPSPESWPTKPNDADRECLNNAYVVITEALSAQEKQPSGASISEQNDGTI